jgi:hypothetical protein
METHAAAMPALFSIDLDIGKDVQKLQDGSGRCKTPRENRSMPGIITARNLQNTAADAYRRRLFASN